MQTPEDVASSSANGSAVTPVPEASEPRLNGDARSGAHGVPDRLHALQTMRVGDFSVRMAGDRVGIIGKIADTFNEIAATNQRIARQLERPRQRVRFGLSDGAWGELEGSVNSLIDDLLWPTTEVTRAVAAVAQGDLLQTV